VNDPFIFFFHQHRKNGYFSVFAEIAHNLNFINAAFVKSKADVSSFLFPAEHLGANQKADKTSRYSFFHFTLLLFYFITLLLFYFFLFPLHFFILPPLKKGVRGISLFFLLFYFFTFFSSLYYHRILLELSVVFLGEINHKMRAARLAP